MRNAENHIPKRTSAFIYGGAAHFRTQKMGKLQLEFLEFTHAVCHNNGHYQQRQAVSICTPFAKYWTLSIK
jgi:hypothetical protein